MKAIAIEKACIAAREKFEKLNSTSFNDIKSKLDYVLGSYNSDKNPIGLYEIGADALGILKSLKKEKPRLVSKKLISSIEKALKTQ